MKIINAIGNADIVKEFYETTGVKTSYLISYPYLKGQAIKLTKTYRPFIDLLFLDSGAFSIFKGVSKVNVSEYSLYINRYGEAFDEIFNLDEDFSNPEVNLRNQQYLVDHLPPGRKRPVPVIHDPKDPFEEVKSYLGLGYDYIAVGSTMKSKNKLFEQIKKEFPDLKVHLFGDLNRKTLIAHKPYSADSTGYVIAAGQGNICYWHPSEQKEYMLYLGERDKEEDQIQGKEGGKVFHFKDFKYRKEVEAFLAKTFNYTYGDLLAQKEKQWIVNMYFNTLLENYINSLP